MNRLSDGYFGKDAGTCLLSFGLFCSRTGLLLLLFLALGQFGAPVQAAQNNPYFSSLKADEVNVRKGPGSKYDVLWVYRSLGLPVEVTATHEHWRRVRDAGGSEGWVYFRLLSRLRMALVSPWEKQKTLSLLRKTKEIGSVAIANLEPGVQLLVKSCNGNACLVSLEGFKGWIEQTRLWGVYPGEIIN